jgi:hypothetical protein
MVNWRKHFIWTLVVIVVSGMNLSSMCDHPLPLNLDLGSKVNTSASETSDYFNAVSYVQPEELSWRTLSDVEFKDVYIEELDAYYWKPTFGEAVTAVEGKEVFITGYIIPVDYDEDFYVLSRYPYANCFFCGGAGPESVVDLRFKSKTRKYKTDERLTFTGKLELNADDVYQMNYILQEAIEFD